MRVLENAAVAGQRVIVRLALDVTLSGGPEPLVLDDRRLRESLTTLHYLLERGAKLILIGKLGRPEGKVEPTLSLRPVFLHLSALLKKPITFAPALFSEATKQAVVALEDGGVLGLENLEFQPEELNNSRTFAQKLAEYGQLYVDDDFPKAHHAVASNVAITEFLPSYAGLGMEKEWQVLTNLLRHPAHPFIAVIGGAKADKLPVIGALVRQADRVLVGGAVANIFLKATGHEVGASPVDEQYLSQARQIFQAAAGRIILPVDHKTDEHGVILDIGPNTVTAFSQVLKSAKTIFWNGDVGKAEEPAYQAGSDAIAHVIAESGATTVVGGGNTLEIIDRLGLYQQLTFISSGGGATLALLAGQKLPAVEALN
jgi:phosphoglycerate kinase